MTKKCNATTEVWARVCGFFRPVKQWNAGKRQEYRDRVAYQVKKNARPAEGVQAERMELGTMTSPLEGEDSK